MSTILPFHETILSEIHDPATSDLLVIGRGLGLRRIVCTLLKIYDSPQNLVLLVNATQEEETEIGEELGLMGCRKPGLRIVGYETGSSRDRQDLYKKGGLIAVTSRILVVDMLQNDIPINMITGIIVLHAEKVSPLHVVSFITRLYREKNTTGFLKAFTDQPEHITSGLSPLKNVMKELHLRRVSIYPRFHQNIKDTLERKRADVIELAQNLTESMTEIHGAIVHCMNMILADLRRSKDLDLEGLSLPAAYFSSFDHIVRKQLDPIWHKVGTTTKALVRDLGQLRRLVSYLLTYDPLQFHSFCQSLLAAINEPEGGSYAAPKSEWMMTDSATTIFELAKARCFLNVPEPEAPPPPTLHEVDDEDIWDAFDEAQGTLKDKNKDKNKKPTRPKWLPPNIQPVLEELPKWSLLAEVLEEIEHEILRMENTSTSAAAALVGTNTTLVMCSSTVTCSLLNEFLTKMDVGRAKGEWGRKMMMQRLKSWLFWEERRKWEKEHAGGNAGEGKKTGGGTSGGGGGVGAGSNDFADGLSEALKKKDRERAQKQANRRRIRGGGPAGGSSRAPTAPPEAAATPAPVDVDFFAGEDMALIDLNDEEILLNLGVVGGDISTTEFATEFDAHYGLIPPPQQVLIRAYSDDTDDRMLDEIKPRFIVMFEPCMEFVRRVEVYKCSNPHMGVRVYHMVYADSCEEHKYLAGIRREKDSFERLIRERGSMLLPILEDRRSTENDAMIKTISSRIAGGRRELSKTPSQVVVDMREFRSTLPSLLHASNLLVIPATLTVGDYILTPEICVERKSLSDLVSSFNSGRLYTQCEFMSAHYKNPVLLIEFEEDKAFSLDMVSEIKSYGKVVNKFPPKKKPTGKPGEQEYKPPSIQSKIVLLTLTFPRLRIIWSSSPYSTAEIFADLKKERAEPDPVKAIAIGADEDPEAGAGVNAAAEELLRSFPGITGKNVKFVMSKIRNVRELCEMDLSQVQGILGVEPGKACHEFLHKGERSKTLYA
ncbi:DNA repair protein RAD16 [Marasmius tenuissimus]|uniref:DNA repair protein RAD16 n=1 Tax=Marasmius tenuissimus TaxID=585030 RepID=A0ABR2ZKS4_9AGAR